MRGKGTEASGAWVGGKGTEASGVRAGDADEAEGEEGGSRAGGEASVERCVQAWAKRLPSAKKSTLLARPEA